MFIKNLLLHLLTSSDFCLVKSLQHLQQLYPAPQLVLEKIRVANVLVSNCRIKQKTKIAKEIHARWSEVYERTKVFTETARRTRRIATGDMKGSEFGVVLFAAFPSLVLILQEYNVEHW